MSLKEKISINSQSSIKIDCGITLRFDPYRLNEEPHDADVIFITHSHGDHFSPDDIKKVSKSDTVIVIPETIIDAVTNAGFSPNCLVAMKPCESTTVNGVSVTSVPSYNTNKPMHPKKNAWLGYIVAADGERVYVSGDTDATPEGEAVDCDVAIIPIGGTYTMNAEEAAGFINKMRPKTVIPSHYGSIVGTPEDGEKLASLVDDGIEVSLKLL